MFLQSTSERRDWPTSATLGAIFDPPLSHVVQIQTGRSLDGDVVCFLRRLDSKREEFKLVFAGRSLAHGLFSGQYKSSTKLLGFYVSD
jgi:hypothetical protein